MSGAELKALAAEGGFRPDDVVRREDQAQWVAARQVQGLFASAARAGAETTQRAPVTVPPPAPAANPYTAPQAPTRRSLAEARDAIGLSGAQMGLLRRRSAHIRTVAWCNVILLVIIGLSLWLVGRLPAGTEGRSEALAIIAGVGLLSVLIVLVAFVRFAGGHIIGLICALIQCVLIGLTFVIDARPPTVGSLLSIFAAIYGVYGFIGARRLYGADAISHRDLTRRRTPAAAAGGRPARRR